jgi:hypothetical protein
LGALSKSSWWNFFPTICHESTHVKLGVSSLLNLRMAHWNARYALFVAFIQPRPWNP